MLSWQTITTVILFTAFILMGLILYWPHRDKPYKDAEKLALKEDGDELITPRQQNKEIS